MRPSIVIVTTSMYMNMFKGTNKDKKAKNIKKDLKFFEIPAIYISYTLDELKMA